MEFYTESEAREVAASKVRSGATYSSSSQILKESCRLTNDHQRFDIFLSHSILDADLVLGIKLILESQGYKVYVDWHDDPQVSRDSVSKKTAELLRVRMRQSNSLIYVASDNSKSSKWMPWELGYFDGYSEGLVSILPLVEKSYSSFNGQEYLSLYPVVSKDRYTNGSKDIFVQENGTKWMPLSKFAKGSKYWHQYS